MKLNSRQSKNKKYDFKMGGKLRGFVKNCGLSIIHEEDIFDSELAFEGPAEPGITKSWESRFDRMVKFRETWERKISIRSKVNSSSACLIGIINLTQL